MHCKGEFTMKAYPASPSAALTPWHCSMLLDEGGLRTQVIVDCVTEPRDGFNVRAFIPGTEKPNERVLIHAHRDDGACSGANDNGTGTVCIMMLAEIMSKLPQPARTIEFISTGSEEGISDGMVQYSTLPTVRRK